MVAMSSPSTLSQACIAWPVSASGSPEAKPSSVTTTSRCSRGERSAAVRRARPQWRRWASGDSREAVCLRAPRASRPGLSLRRLDGLLVATACASASSRAAGAGCRPAHSRSVLDPVEQADVALALEAERRAGVSGSGLAQVRR